MNLASIVKILVLVATIAQTLLGVLTDIIPAEVSMIINAVVAGILAFTTKIGGEAPKE